MAVRKRQKDESELHYQVYIEQQKIKRRVRDLQRQGYTVPDNMIPNIPKNPTDKTLYRFQTQYTPSKIREKSVFTNPQGVTVSGAQHFKESMSERSRKSAETRKKYYQKEVSKMPTQKPVEMTEQIIDNLYDAFEYFGAEMMTLTKLEQKLDNYESSKQDTGWYFRNSDIEKYKDRDKTRLEGVLNGAIAEVGREQVAINAAAKADELNDLFMRALYESGNKYRVDSRQGTINSYINAIARILYGRSLTPSESEYFSSLGEVNESHEKPQ